VWTRTAAAGNNSITTTHNASNYPVIFHWFEFAAGSTFVKSISSTGIAIGGGAGPALTGLTGTNLIMGARGYGITGSTATTMTWSSGVEAIDTFVANATTDGYLFSITYLEDSVLTSSTLTNTNSANTVLTGEGLAFAVSVSGAAPSIPPILVMQTRRAY
jgi:hypothetical protein